VTGDKYFDRYSFGQCIGDLPPQSVRWPWFEGKYQSAMRGKLCGDVLSLKRYKMVVRCGGIYSVDDEYSNRNDLVLFNAANLNDTGTVVDAFHLALPAFSERMESPAVCYDGGEHLLSFGGYSYSSGKALKSIFSLSLDAKLKRLKWKKYGASMLRPRYESAAAHFVGHDGVHRVLVIGGRGSNSKPSNAVELFDSSATQKRSKCAVLRELNFKRSRPGHCQLEGRRVAVTGGIQYGGGTHSVEIYSLHKDCWTVHPTPLQYEHLHPAMWTLRGIDPNILYVAANSVRFGAKKGSLGFVEWTDLRVKAKHFELLHNEPLDAFYHIDSTRGNLWEPRALMHFAM